MWYAFEDKLPETGRPIFVMMADRADERPFNPGIDNAEEFDPSDNVPINMVSGLLGMAKDIGFGVCIFRSRGHDPMAEQLGDFEHAGLMSAGMWCYVADLVRHSGIADRVTGDVMTEQDTDAGHIRGEIYMP